MTHRILFVSKAVAPPYRDGATVLVRDLASAITSSQPTVLSTIDAPRLQRVRMNRIYRQQSRYAPSIFDNARVFGHLALDGHDLWHFVFAPNPATSYAGHLLRTVRRKPVVQTVASRPLKLEGANRLLFGDRVVTLSRHTADSLTRNGARIDKIAVIPAPVADLQRSDRAQCDARRRAGIEPGAPLFVYAGDLEFSQGAKWMAQCIPGLLSQSPDAIVAFACRGKTAQAASVQDALQRQLRPYASRVRFLGEVEDLPALIASATALPFPVDDLYGKVDIPYVVLEAALLRVPVMVPAGTPAAEVEGIATMQLGDIHALQRFCLQMQLDQAARHQRGAALRQSVKKRHNPASIAQQIQSLYDRLLR